ncbi:zinc-binding dehydrogenase [Microbacterium sp. Se5.02b]|uniref:zinc-binding dehydrogenase n=1 Tax=Microbacterium sp. Se5.02b TaxID=2864103 RepID=UPI00215DB7F4|nr:zinc-binding dehydrogenase [Microbacterium sp. Se5.02b]
MQLAALRGAEVWASCSRRNAPLVERLGAVRTFDHRESPLSELPSGRFDAIIDIAGGIPLRELQRLVVHGGSIVLVTGDGGHVLGPVPRMLRAAALSLGARRIRPLAATPRPEVLAKLLELVAEGRVVPVVEREYPFAEASAALAHLEAGHTVGKVVVHGS